MQRVHGSHLGIIACLTRARTRVTNCEILLQRAAVAVNMMNDKQENQWKGETYLKGHGRK